MVNVADSMGEPPRADQGAPQIAGPDVGSASLDQAIASADVDPDPEEVTQAEPTEAPEGPKPDEEPAPTAPADKGSGDDPVQDERGGDPAADPESTETGDVDPGLDTDGSGYHVAVQQSEVDTVLIVHRVDLERPRIEYRPDTRALGIELDATRLVGDQRDEVTGMLEHLGQELQAALSPSGLSIRLDHETYPEFAERVARHAAKDPAWRALRGKVARHGDDRQLALRDYMKRVIETQDLVAELDDIFAALGLRIEIAAVEACEALRPGDRWLRRHGVRGHMLLPTGCSARFKFKQARADGSPDAPDVDNSHTM